MASKAARASAWAYGSSAVTSKATSPAVLPRSPALRYVISLLYERAPGIETEPHLSTRGTPVMVSGLALRLRVNEDPPGTAPSAFKPKPPPSFGCSTYAARTIPDWISAQNWPPGS
jgi:hypothetical protein